MVLGAILMDNWPVLNSCYGGNVGWGAAGALVGGYSKEARNGNMGSAALATLKTWAVGIPVRPSRHGIPLFTACMCVKEDVRCR